MNPRDNRKAWLVLDQETRRAKIDAMRRKFPYASGNVLLFVCIAENANIISLEKFKKAKEIKCL